MGRSNGAVKADAPPGVPALKSDQYENFITALGTSGDKSSHTRPGGATSLAASDLDALYEGGGLAARIVDRVVDDAVRLPFALTGTDQAFDWPSLMSELDAIDAVNQLADAWRWSRLYGGALAILVVNDGLEMSQPLQLARANRLESIHVVESPCAQPALWDPRLGSDAFRRPAYYDLTDAGVRGADKRTVSRVHRSRVIRFDGVKLAPRRLHARAGWGPSVLERVWVALRRLGTSLGYSEAILHEISSMILKIKGFRAQVAGAAEGRRQLQDVFGMMRWAIDNLNTLVLDSEDSYSESTRSVQGLATLLGCFVDGMLRETDMPRTVLFGTQPGGLNAEASGEIRSWYDSVAVEQNKKLTPALNRILDVMIALRKKRGEKVPSEWTIEYEPLWKPTDQEAAATALVRAQARAIYADKGWVAPDEVREQLIEEGEVDDLVTPLLEEPALGT